MPIDLRANEKNLQDVLAKLKEPQIITQATAVIPPVVESSKLEFTFLVGETVHLEGKITNIIGDEIHVQLAENNRTYIFPRKLFVEAHS